MPYHITDVTNFGSVNDSFGEKAVSLVDRPFLVLMSVCSFPKGAVQANIFSKSITTSAQFLIYIGGNIENVAADGLVNI